MVDCPKFSAANSQVRADLTPPTPRPSAFPAPIGLLRHCCRQEGTDSSPFTQFSLISGDTARVNGFKYPVPESANTLAPVGKGKLKVHGIKPANPVALEIGSFAGLSQWAKCNHKSRLAMLAWERLLPMWLVLKMEEGPPAKEYWWPLETCKGHTVASPQSL